MIDYQMKNGIFTVDFTGNISFDAIINYLDDFEKLTNLPDRLRLLYDFREADFDLDHDKVKLVSKKAEGVTTKYSDIRSAFLVEEPKSTAYTMLFSMMGPKEKTSRELFSTYSAAVDWLLGY